MCAVFSIVECDVADAHEQPPPQPVGDAGDEEQRPGQGEQHHLDGEHWLRGERRDECAQTDDDQPEAEPLEQRSLVHGRSSHGKRLVHGVVLARRE